MKKSINLIGRKFGDLVVERRLSSKEWSCRCACGNHIRVSTEKLLSGKCSHCRGHSGSSGELLIASILQENNIKFKRERTFTDFIYEDTGKKPRFDFYVFGTPSYIIEFDGAQHYMSIDDKFYNSDLQLIQIRDRIKDKYCFDHNIPIIRIPYTIQSRLNIEDLLLETSKYVIKEY